MQSGAPSGGYILSCLWEETEWHSPTKSPETGQWHRNSL
nr:MAG TPA: hypothetical protein [Caudoviricetes sp.]